MSGVLQLPDFGRLLVQLLDRLESLHKLPTLAHPDDITNALRNLPISLPDVGAGATDTTDYLEKVILPSLAPGHAGPRLEMLWLRQ
jgi:hypothetical protein